MAEEAKESVEQPPLEIVRADEFETLYANNVQFQSTLWDLRLTFGEVDINNNQIVQHTAINLAWPQAKIVAYFTLANLVIHQGQNGNVLIPNYAIPPRLDPDDPKKPFEPKMAAYLSWIHDQIFGSNPYVPQEVAAYDKQPPATSGQGFDERDQTK